MGSSLYIADLQFHKQVSSCQESLSIGLLQDYYNGILFNYPKIRN